MKSERELDRSDFVQFCKKLSQLWESTSFENLLNQAKEELLNTKPIMDLQKCSEADNGYGIYCFWIEQEALEDLEDFKKSWNEHKGNFALTQPTKKWYSNNKIAGNNLRPFYMGKREKVLKRIKEHAFNSSPATYGLHLYRNDKRWQ